MLKHPRQMICERNAGMTYEDLVVYIELFSKTIADERCCAILCGSEMSASIALLSCFAAGVTAVPLSVRYGEIYCNKILDYINPTAVITDTDGKLSVLHIKGYSYAEPKNKPALIMCTSGTTGKPKGVMLSEDNILANIKDIAAYFKIDSSDMILISRPLYHCAVLTGEFLTSIIKGINIRFDSDRFNPEGLLKTIEEKGITVFCGTPTILGMMARFNKNRSCGLKTICISGERLHSVVAEKIKASFPNAAIYHVYGLTEACPRVSFLAPELFEKYPECVGIPLNSVSIRIEKQANLDDGILWVKGPNIMMGYFNDQEQTSRTMKDGWLCTGDIACLTEQGLIKIKGRIDDLIIRAGMNIYPQEIEGALKGDPRVKEVLVYKTYDNMSNIQIGMKIVGDFSNKQEVIKLCSEALPTFQVPSVIEMVDELPKNGSGKVIRSVNND